MTPRLPRLVCMLCLVAGTAHGWNGADDERRRQHVLEQWPSGIARLEGDSTQALHAAQTTWRNNRLTLTGTAAASASSAPHTLAVASTAPPLAPTLAALRTQALPGTTPVAAPGPSGAAAFARVTARAQAGHPLAAVQAGRMAYAGAGTPRDDARALHWFKRASELGNPDGSYHYGYLRTYGYGIDPDPADGVAWYHRAALAGSASGQLAYALALLTGSGVARQPAQAMALLQQALRYDPATDTDTGLPTLQASAAATLGELYRTGRVVDKNPREALRWYAVAARLGDGFAARDAAKMLAQGDGVAVDTSQALAWNAHAAAAGHPTAQAELGLLLVQGGPVPKDLPTGLWLVREAARKGNSYAWSLMGRFHYTGALPVDYAQSVQAYRTAVALGYGPARMALTPQLLRLATLSAAASAAQKDRALAQGGDAAAMLRMADRCAVGLGLPADRNQALAWYQKATAQGNTAAEAMLGHLLITGQAGASDNPKGTAHVRHAALAGDPGAMYSLGQLYESGVLQEADAKTTARQWYQKAADAGNPMAVQRLLGKP